jgi:hypothetical protein
MTDVVEIARERQARLTAEIGRLDDFIRMAEALLQHSRLESSKALDTEDKKAAGGNGAEAGREDLSARELKAEELVRKSRTIHNEPAPDPRGFSFKQQLQRWSSP